MPSSTKTEEEIVLLKEGGKRLAAAVASTAAQAVPGVSTAKLDEAVTAMIRAGGDEPAFLGYSPRGAKRPYPATLCVSVNEEVVHGVSNEDPRTLKEGDVVSLDCGLVHGGLITDHAITIIVGEGDKASRRLVQATREALDAAIAAARPGNHTGDIGNAVEEVADRYGFGIAYELGGHGVGHRVHEEPFIANVGDKGTGELLVPGMVLALEPILTEGMDGRVKLMKDGYTYVTRDGSRAAHFEHTILITDGAAEVLTVS